MKLDNMFTALNISASGLSAQRKKLNAISSNIANINTTRTRDGKPYERKIVEFRAKEIPSFERYLQRTRLKLTITRPDHIPFQKIFSNRPEIQEGVESEVKSLKQDFRKVYEPDNPDADEEGYVYYPNINVISEMVDMIAASRAYEANLNLIETSKRLAKETLKI